MHSTSLLSASRRQFLIGTAATAFAGVTGGMPTSALAKAPMLGTQAPAFYRFKIGAFEATVLSDGPIQMGDPQPNIFAGLSAEEFTKTLSDNRLPTSDIKLEQNALVLNTGSHLILFDTGTGSDRSFGPSTGRLLVNLKAAGYEPGDIDVVALTHAHPDHCWGLLADDGRRHFPNAQIYLSEADLKFWTDESNGANDFLKTMIAGTRKQLLPTRERIVFVKDGQEIVSGVQAIATPGHTVGHTSFMLTSEGKSFCNIGDVAHHHVISVERPRLAFGFDTDGKQGVASRLKLFDMLAADRIPFVGYHFLWPGIGHVGKQGDGFRYFPAPLQMAL
jgi:glyoxylase-like metal-dependent hydrolase (beta-lactamase superfamily II)